MAATKSGAKKDGTKRGLRVRVRPPVRAKSVAGAKSAEAILLSNYAAAAARAQRLGRPLELVITVPAGRAKPVVKQRVPEADALDHALAAARQRGARKVAEILKSPDMMSARDFGKLIGASHETVNQKRRTGALLALEGAIRGLRYPRWQVTDDGRPLPGLAELSRVLGGGPWAVYRFLVHPHAELGGRTALAALKANDVEPVMETARGVSRGDFA